MPTRIPRTEPRGARPRSSFSINPLQHVRYLYAIFVQGVFYSLPRGEFHWESDLQDTEIVITAESPLFLGTLNDRPGITFTRAPVSFFQLGFDDMLNLNDRTGKKTKSLLIPGTMIINCCSKNDLESEQIAWTTAEKLWLLRDLLMQQGFYDVGRNLQVGAPSKAGTIVEGDGADEWFCTSIVSPYHFYRTSSFLPLGRPVLHEIEINACVGVTVPIEVSDGTVNPLSQPPVYPLPPFAPGAGDPNIRTAENPEGLPIVPHPLNPAIQVLVRSPKGIRAPSMNGHVLPIANACVEESVVTAASRITVKV